jgi:hypothetical protein
MAGSDPTPGDSGNGGNGRLVADQLKDRMIMALIAIIFGGGTTIGYQNAFPEAVRPDPWTGTMAKDAHEHMRNEWRDIFNRYESRVQRDITRLEKDIENCERKHD